MGKKADAVKAAARAKKSTKVPKAAVVKVAEKAAAPAKKAKLSRKEYDRELEKLHVELVKLHAQDFVFEAAILLAASRELRVPIVSVPIACHYDTAASHSHFHGVRDTLRITWYTVRQAMRYGHLLRSYHAVHGAPPTIYDPDDRLGTGEELSDPDASVRPPSD